MMNNHGQTCSTGGNDNNNRHDSDKEWPRS